MSETYLNGAVAEQGSRSAPEPEVLRLRPEEMRAVNAIASNLNKVRAEVAPQRLQLERQIGELERRVAQAEGMASGAFKAFLLARGIEGDFSLQLDGSIVSNAEMQVKQQ